MGLMRIVQTACLAVPIAVAASGAHGTSVRSFGDVPAGVVIEEGSGTFTVTLAATETPITIHYHRGENHGPTDPILQVLPGRGRNSDDYRDAWIEAAEAFDLLVLSPRFAEPDYPGVAAYNLAGMIHQGANTRTFHDIRVRDDPDAWLFAGLDQVFDVAVTATGSQRTRYDVFGHSAGGQLVHRLVLFAPDARIDRAVAANAGWYTAVTGNAPFPYGLAGAPISERQLATALSRDLTVLLGGSDVGTETRGGLRRTPEADVQGQHRLARGRFFYATARATAIDSGQLFNWSMHIVPGVGHSYAEMGVAAAYYLYGGGS